MILGCICDDFTGASDIAQTLATGGIKTMIYTGVPRKDADGPTEAGVVALKSRSIPARDAVRQSLAALEWLRSQGCCQIVFKYCSTFDSTPAGNIGPVAEALTDALGHQGPVIFCPAFPATGRTVYLGHLFVHDRLLSESGLENHPLTPMTDPDIRRWLAAQSNRGVGHVPLVTVEAGVDAVGAALQAEVGAARPFVICDALTDDHLVTLARASRDLPLLTGGSGIAIGLPAQLTARSGPPGNWSGEDGPAVALSGSCSRVTLDQIRCHEGAGAPVRRVTASAVLGGCDAGDVARWALDAADSGRLPLVYTSADPEEVSQAQREHGREKAAQAIETFFTQVTEALVKAGVRRLIVAGGETAGAAIRALDADAFEVGPAIAPGVPALRVVDRGLVVALKSGNFGGPDFFAEAAQVLGKDTE